MCARWYCKYGISYRDLEEMMAERGLEIDHTTLYRWVQHYAPELKKRLEWHRKRYASTNSSTEWRESALFASHIKRMIFCLISVQPLSPLYARKTINLAAFPVYNPQKKFKLNPYRIKN
jgi:hypothetical protein